MPSDRIATLIIEDEPNARQAIEKLIASTCPEVEIVGEADTVAKGLDQIINLNPDLILMDIQLGQDQSFQILEKIPAHRSHIIFITAYSEYAVEAFRFSAIDYLLKPINPLLLREAVDKVLEKIKNDTASSALDILIQNLQADQIQRKKLVLSTLETMHVVEVSDIIKCQSHMNYTTFYLRDGKELIISKTLKEFEDQLTPHDFFRIHKSWLINKHLIKGYDKTEGGYAIMIDDSKVPVSSMKKEELLIIIKESL